MKTGLTLRQGRDLIAALGEVGMTEGDAANVAVAVDTLMRKTKRGFGMIAAIETVHALGVHEGRKARDE